MLEAMRQLALAHLCACLDAPGDADPEGWYRQTRAERLGGLFPFLVEDVGDEGTGKDKARYYTLEADTTDQATAVLTARELTGEAAARLPFNQPSGSQSAALGPVIKRSAPASKKPPGPSEKIRTTTLKAFAEIGEKAEPWSPYFKAAHACWSRPRLRYDGEVIEGGAYHAAVERIKNEKRTVLLAYSTPDGLLPGQVPEYVQYLQGVLARTKYATEAQGPRPGVCAVCGAEGEVYPNALRGAGLDIANLDRDGAFPGLDVGKATQTFGACVACADLLYVYCRHVSDGFRARVAGEDSLVIPRLGSGPQAEFARSMRDWHAAAARGDSTAGPEWVLLDQLRQEAAVSTINIVWAEFGQRIEGVRGVVTDILPSRLAAIAGVNARIRREQSPFFPVNVLEDFAYDVSLSILRPLLLRHGGKPAQRSNESRRLWELRREVAEAVYHKRGLPNRFMDEALITARSHFEAAARSKAPAYSLTREGYSEKKKAAFLTVAGWVKQLACFLHYFNIVTEVNMANAPPAYQPSVEWLKPYFGPESGLNTLPKAFAFLLGALYGKLLTVQGARGVNVGANALTWLRRLSLSGADLPELYVKVRGKLLEYKTERSRQVRELNEELADLGQRLGDSIPLDDTRACYFLLLGQALAVKLLPSNNNDGDEE